MFNKKTPPPLPPPTPLTTPLRYRTTRHGGNARFLTRRLRVLRIGAHRFRSAWRGGVIGLRVVVGRSPSGHLAYRCSHIEHAAFALQVAAFQLEDVQLKFCRDYTQEKRNER